MTKALKLRILAGSVVLLGYQNCAKTNFATDVQSLEQMPEKSLNNNTVSGGNSNAATPAVSTGNNSTPLLNPSTQVVTRVPSQATPLAQPPAVTKVPVMKAPVVSAPVSPPSSQLPNTNPVVQQQQPPAVQQQQPPAVQPQQPSAVQPSSGGQGPDDVRIVTSMTIDYDGNMKVSRRPGYGIQPVSDLLEAGNRTLISGGSRDATYEEITGGASLKIENPDRTSPVQVTMIECWRSRINDCRTHVLDPNKLEWELIELENTSLYGSSKNHLCVETGQSVAEKRGIMDCGARGPVLAILANRDPSLFDASLNLPTRGTLSYYNSRGYASGKFAIRAKITNKTPGYEEFAGAYTDYTVEIKNRLDLRLTTNLGSVFEGYGIPLVTVNMIGENGNLQDNVTFRSVSCSARLSNGHTVSMTKRKYENRF